MSEEEAEVTTETETEDKGQESWDQTRQFRDELSAANRREGELKEQLRAANDQLTTKPEGEDLSDYDTLVDKVKSISSELASSKQESESLRGDLASINNRSRAEEGKRALNNEVASLEKEFGKSHTNEILKKVNEEYVEFDVASMADKPRAAWIKKNLRLGYLESKPATTNSDTGGEETPASTVDTGTGGSPPTDAIPEGNFKEVAKAMLERDRRQGK